MYLLRGHYPARSPCAALFSSYLPHRPALKTTTWSTVRSLARVRPQGDSLARVGAFRLSHPLDFEITESGLLGAVWTLDALRALGRPEHADA